MTHSELVGRAGKWLQNTRRCPIVATEISTTFGTGESPDAIGWKGPHDTTIVECKATRADFLRDKKKTFRRYWEMGIGQRRFYMTPPGLVKPGELPKGWGLLYCHPKKVEVALEHKVPHYDPQVTYNESPILYSLVRRALLRGFDIDSPYSERKKERRRKR